MVNPAAQQILNNSEDATYASYGTSTQNVPATMQGNIYITNINEYTTIRVSSPGQPAGNTTEVQFNMNGQMDGDDGLTYNPTTDSLTVLGNLTANILLTDNLYYSNGSPWVFSGSSYSNTNVGAYLSSYSGNITASKITSSLFVGSGANLTNVPAGNITGTVANASHAIVADSANSVAGANVTGTVSLATTATTATSATTAGTVTTAAQPNITSVGSLTGLTVSNSTGVVNFTTTANVTLGAVGNLHISGGTSGQVLSTNGSGTLSWATPSTSNLYNVTNTGNTTNVALSITNTTDSLSFSTGAVTISGGLGVAKAIHTDTHVAAKNTLYAGQYADFSSWEVPKFIGRDAGSTYIQGALINTNANGSADWVSYNDASPTDGSEGWADMGYTGSTFNDPLYTITKANDGYVFVQGINATEGGNFVLATGALGEHHDLVFATGGFLEANEAMRLDHERNIFFVGGHAHTGLSDRVIDLDVNGNIIVSGNINGNLSASPAPSINDFSSAEFVDSLTVGNITISNNLINTNSSATSLLLSANYPASSNALIEIPNFLDGGEKLTIRNDFTNSNGIDIQTSGGIWTFSATGLLEFPGNARVDTSDNSFEVQNANVVNFEAVNTVNIYTDSAGNAYQWQFGDDGNLTVPGNVLPSSNVAYDLGSPTARFKDLYLSGTTIDLGGTLIQAQSNGEVSIGNATFSSSGTISAADVSIGIVELTANTVASLSHIGSMLTYSNVGHGITYDIPNNATTSFAIGSRIELLALSQSSITVEPATGSGVTLITSKDLNTNNPTLSNIQSAKLTKIGTDTWYLGL